MKNRSALTLAALFGVVAMVAGAANPAVAQRDGVMGIDIRPNASHNVNSAGMPTDQRGGLVQDAYGDALGRIPGDGETNGLIGLLKPADQKSITDGTVPTDQRSGYVQGVYDDLLGRETGGEQVKAGVAKVGTGQLVLSGQSTYGGLGGLDSINGLFANSKGGDQANGLLLPAVRGAGGAQQAHGAGGGGGAGKVQMQDFHFTAKSGSDGGTAAHGSGGGGGAGKTADSRAINFTNNPKTGGGPHVAPGTAKGLNFTNTAKK